MTGERNRRILVIDDNRAIHDDFRKILVAPEAKGELDSMEAGLFGEGKSATQRQSYEMDSAYQGEEGLELVRKSIHSGKRYGLAFVDMRMPPGWDGLQTIEKVWEVDPDIQVVICTAYSDYSWEEIAKKFESGDRLLILKKPFDTVEVCQLACALMEKWHLARRAHLKLGQLRGMVHEQTRELELTNRRLMDEIDQRKRSEDRYRLAESGVNDGLWDWDLVSGKVYFSPRWKEMLGYGDAEIGDSAEEWFKRIHPEDLPRLRGDHQQHLEGRSEQLRGEYRILHKDGQYRWILCRGVAVRDASGAAVRAAGSFTDITDRRMAEEQLRFDALHDSLTGLANRTRLTDRVGHCLARSRRHPDEQFAVLFLDLDQFKVINESLGHELGDKLLVEVGKRLGGCVREVDTLSRPGEDQVARIGGDEFVLLLENIRHEADALRVADRVHQALGVPTKLEGHEVCTHVSIGVTIGHAQYERAEDILRDADTALYQAKAAGKACTRMFDPEMHDRAMTRWRTEMDLRHAIDSGQLVAYYQPVMDSDGRLSALETLVRWQHPTRGLLQPDAFIAIAEETGLIVPLGRWVMMAACRQARKWQVQFPSLGSLSVGVNVSSKQFSMRSIADDVAKILAESGLAPACLRMEVTETVAMQRADISMQTLSRLSAMGVQIDVDDFGTGYSSLSYLHRMPISALKIDRGFVRPMCVEETSRSIVQAIMALARALRLQVTAEGVETVEHVEALRAMGCDRMQGLYFGAPMGVEEATKFIAECGRERLAKSG